MRRRDSSGALPNSSESLENLSGTSDEVPSHGTSSKSPDATTVADKGQKTSEIAQTAEDFNGGLQKSSALFPSQRRRKRLTAGAFVLDPMCGLGTILLEAATEWPNVYYFGSDISDSQLQGAYSNIRDASLIDKIELFKSSVTGLPFLSESIDVILTDIPFGKKFKRTEDSTFLPRVFQELERVLRFGGTVVLLLNQELYRCISNDIAHGCQTERSIFAESSTDCKQSDLISVEQDSKKASISYGTVSPSSQDARKEHLSYKKADLGSLVFMESFEVSLGKTNAFICKYKKIT